MSGCIAPFLHTPSLLEQGEFYCNVADLCPRWTTLIRGSKGSDCKMCRVFFIRSDIERPFVYLFGYALINDVSTSVMPEGGRNGSRR
jgi:hypothetical protein